MDVKKHLDLTKTKAAKQQRREDDTSFILCTAVNSDDSLERKKRKKKKTAEEVTYMVRENERERSAGSGFYLWFIYVPLNGFLPPTPVEDSH